MENKRVLLFPGGFQSVKNYGGFEGVDIWLKTAQNSKPLEADYFVGHSAGAIFALTLFGINQDSKFILINPLIGKRNILSLLFRWIKFFVFEGIGWEKIVPISQWAYGMKMALKLLKVDALKIIKTIPKANLFIIRGKNDKFFCDEKTRELIKTNCLNLIEVEAGHDWNKNIDLAVTAAINSY